MNKSFEHLPKDKRKKILLITDDIRVHSGVATVGKEIVIHTAHHYNWCQIAGSIKHPEKGKALDMSADVGKFAGIDDASCMLYPVDGYGDGNIFRQIWLREKPDAVLLITDPRYFHHIFKMEREIRKKIPITYLNIWDDLPAPLYNKPFYQSCDLLMGISKQTVFINKTVLGDDIEDRICNYVPHGLNSDVYRPITELDKEYSKFLDFKKKVHGSQEVDFTLFFNSRNIRRKQIPDSMLAFRGLLDSLPLEKAKRCKMILHTEPSSDHGTNLVKVSELLFDEKYKDCIVFSTSKLPPNELNYLYNIADAQILLTSNEGWGLTLTEAILTGTPIIANVTGGMQDQMRFVDDKGEWFTPNDDVPSNHRGTYKEHGEWAFPVYPTSRSMQGSPPTPYIYDDRCAWEDASARLIELYNMDPEERKRRGYEGRKWAVSDEAGFTHKHQAERFMSSMEELFSTWKPRTKHTILNTNEYKGKFLKHKLIY